MSRRANLTPIRRPHTASPSATSTTLPRLHKMNIKLKQAGVALLVTAWFAGSAVASPVYQYQHAKQGVKVQAAPQTPVTPPAPVTPVTPPTPVAAPSTMAYGSLTFVRPSLSMSSLSQNNAMCSGTINGSTGWRVPSIAELNEFSAGTNKAALAAKGWVVKAEYWYWSATQYGGARMWVGRLNGQGNSVCINNDNADCAYPVCVK